MDKPEIIVSDEAFKWELAPVLLLAGPGTGKTYQLAKRIQYLTEEKGVPPGEITVITFTTEAARSMRQKLQKPGSHEYVPAEKRPGRISTMHSLGQTILVENPALAGLKDGFTVVESADLKRMLLRDAALLEGLTQEDARNAFDERGKGVAGFSEKSKKIISKYEEILRACNAIDFDDQIALACKVLREHKDIREKYRVTTTYLLVDEYQDINSDQFELIKLLSDHHVDGLFVVGDDDQSIYSFRGGSPEYIRSFHKYFGEKCVVIQMQTSRRCRQNIMDNATCIVAKFDGARLDKGQYKFGQPDPGAVYTHNCPSDDREAEIIGAIIKEDMRVHEEKGGERKAFILVPNRLYSQKIQGTLRKFGIRFSVQFPDDESSWRSFFSIKAWAESPNNLTARQCIELLIEGGTTSIPTSRSRKDPAARAKGIASIANLWKEVLAGKMLLEEAINGVAKKDATCRDIVEKMAELRKAYTSNDTHRFLSKATELTKTWSSRDKFFDDADKLLRRNRSNAESAGGAYEVRILTMQSAKGLEAELVFIVGMEEGGIPREVGEKQLAEEARLFFVAMTRAKDHLHLFHCRKRTSAVTYRAKPNDLKVSRFIECFPKDKVDKQYHQPKDKLKK